MGLDKISAKIAGWGVPTLIIIVAMQATGYVGAAALTTALAALGFSFGMVGGIAILVSSALIIDATVKFGFDKVFEAVVKQLYKKGESKETIIFKINKYPVSKDLKLKLKDKLEKM